MNKKSFFKKGLCLLLVVVMILTIKVSFYEPSKINAAIASKVFKAPANTSFVDDNFYKCIIDNYNEDNGTKVAYTTKLTDSQLASIEYLSCDSEDKPKTLKIKDVSGLSKLTGLLKLDLDYNDVNEIDVSKNVKLQSLYLNDNNLSEINVANNTKLEKLEISNNDITNIDISKNLLLENFSISNNKISTIDVSKNTKLEWLYVDSNNIAKIDLSNNTNIMWLNLLDNYLSEIILNENIIKNENIYYADQNAYQTQIKYSDNKIIKPSSDYKYLMHDRITIKEEIDVNTLISNLGLTGFTAKVFDEDENEITSGNVKYNYILKIYEEEEIVQELDIKIFNNQSGFKDEVLYESVVYRYNLTHYTEDDIPYTQALTDEQLKTITTLYAGGYYILDSTGIEKLINLTELDLSFNRISTIDVSKNTKLIKLDVSYNRLNNINVNNNLELESLDVSNNDLTSIDISKEAKLKELDVSYNKLKTIDVSKNAELLELNLYDNKLNNINVANNSKLISINAGSNEIIGIDVSNNQNLTTLELSNNNLTSINVSNYVGLIKLDLRGNLLESLDLSKNINLTELDLYSNLLESIDLSKNINLIKLDLNCNNLTNIDVTKNVKLEGLDLSLNELSSINLANNLELKQLDVGNNQLTTLDVSKNTKLTSLSAESNSLTNINLNNNALLELLYLNENEISSIDLSKNVVLSNFYISYNKLSEIDVSKNIELYTLNVDNNKLTNIDLSNNLSLEDLTLSGNNLTLGDTLILKGQEVELSNIKLPKDNEKIYMTYGVKDTSIATSKSNKIKGVKVGKTTVTGTIVSDNDKVTATGTVTIYDVTSSVYTVNADSIDVGDEIDKTKILANIKIEGTDKLTKTIENNKLLIKQNDAILKSYNIISVISFGNLVVGNNNISLNENMSYSDFTSNITTNGVTYKIFNGDAEVTSGTVSKGMTLKVYKDGNVISTYNITDEYLDMSKVSVKEDKKHINGFGLEKKVSELKQNISTSGKVTITNPKGVVLTDTGILTTGTKVKIELATETKEYTVVIKGDVTGTGEASVSDVAKLYQYLKKKITMEDCYIEAGNVYSVDNEIKINDIAKLYQYIKGKIDTLD